MIALLLNNSGVRGDYQGNLRRGVEQACIDRDIDLWVYSGRVAFELSDGVQRRVFQLLSQARIDGLVVAAGCIATSHRVSELLDLLRRQCPVPMCTVGEDSAGVASLTVDNRSGAAELGEHLVREHGKRRFAYIAGPRGHQESDERLNGLRAALARHGLSLEPEAVGYGNFMAPSGAEVARQLLDRGCSFDALVAANDDMARGALETLVARGLACPESVAVAGFDDSRNARITRPALTTVRQPTARLGSVAVARLAAAWTGRSLAGTVTLPTELVLRQSCGCRADRVDRGTRNGARSPSRRRAQLRESLALVAEDGRRRNRWAAELCRALDAEHGGARGALPEAFFDLLADMPHPLVPVQELERIINVLRSWSLEAKMGPRQEDSFNAARALVMTEAARREATRSQQHEALLEELRVSGEQLATALTLPALTATLHARLPRFGIRNAMVSLFAPEGSHRLVPLMGLVDGVPMQASERSYPAELVLPDEALCTRARRSLTVMPLTFQREQLGVAALELPGGFELSTLLREQIGSAIKTVRMHEDSLNQERLRAQAQEEKRATAERLRSLQLIAGGVAHDLNNALGPLIALPQAILHDLRQGAEGTVSPDVREDLEAIQRAGLRASLTIRDLLSLGQPSAMSTTRLDLNRLLREEASMLERLCQKEPGIVVSILTGERPLVVQASRPHLVRALSNLVLNAIDAIRSPGVITIRAFPRHLAERLEGVESVAPGAYAVVEVEDTGAGIPPEQLPQVLEPFFTARRRPGDGGTGLGLTIVQRIVKDSLGYLQVESEIGKGTIFSR